ncbi:MAG: S9 family peptidase [Hyphomicrobiales bacterium]
MTVQKQIKPFGTWPSPISPELVAGQSIRFGLVRAHNNAVYWTEGRPSEGGRGVIMRTSPDGGVEELLPNPYSARSKVHEYGGGEFMVTDNGVYFANADDQDIYLITPKNKIERITNAKAWRFADFCIDATRRRLIAVGEYHREEHDPSPENALVTVSLTDGTVERLVTGADFYAAPRVSPDTENLAWLEWDLPGMPWDGARVMCGKLSGNVNEIVAIAGGDGSAAFQPEWAADGTLYFIWDETGFGQLYRHESGNTPQRITQERSEFGLPLWGLGVRSFALIDNTHAMMSGIRNGEHHMAVVNLETGALTWLDIDIAYIYGVCPTASGVATQVARHDKPSFVAEISVSGEVTPIRDSASISFDAQDVSPGEIISFESSNGRTAWAVYYAPQSASYSGPNDSAPPLIVSAHGGPTGMADRGLKMKIQYWTSRGFAYLDVDYTGSFGYGRAYMEALNGLWGIADVDDVVAGAKALVARGLADPSKLFISGGSAGGYTVLCALAFRNTFSAGASYYGIGDLKKLQDLTHKFESGYLHALIGTEEAFKERSPLHHAEGVSVPVIFFQGGRDFVVPPQQSRDMVASLKARGIEVEYSEFPDEGHGFRAGDVISRCLDEEYAFYLRQMKS